MLTMDAFRQDAFAAVSLSAAVDKLGYVPQLLGSIPGLFVKTPVRTTAVWMEERDNMPVLIQTAPRSSPPKVRGAEQRTARSFVTKAIGEGARIMADELQGIRAFGSETEEKALMTEVARRQLLVKNDMELTKENYRLSVVTQAKMLDADGSTIYDWAAEFGLSATGPLGADNPIVNWDLLNTSPASGVVRQLCNQTQRWVYRALKGVGGSNVEVMAMCGDQFWDALTMHPEVRQTYLNWPDALKLRSDVGKIWDSFKYGNILFFNYRSTDDAEPATGGVTGTEATPAVGVYTDNAAFFPSNAGIFVEAYAPAPRMEFVNTPGLETYSWVITDEKRDMWADVEMFSYPLTVCTVPNALVTAKRTSADT